MKKKCLTALALFLTIVGNAQTLSSEWTTSFGGNGSDAGYSISTDSNGNIYVTGSFSGTVDFDPGSTVENLTSQGAYDVFIQKLDPNGNLLWVKRVGGFDNDRGYAVNTDGNDNVYVTGIFTATVDFDPNFPINNLSSFGAIDLFVQKLDPDGNLIWVKQIGSIGNDLGTSTLDPNGYIYTTGSFVDTLDIDPNSGVTQLISHGQSDIFIQKLDLDGNFIWAKRMGGSSVDYPNSIIVDSDGNICTTGGFNETVDFNPDSGTNNLTSQGLTDIFVQKLTDDGSFLWAKQIGGISFDQGRSIKADNNGNFYIAGGFAETVDFDPTSGTTSLTSLGSTDAFIQKLDTDGNLVWVKQMGGNEFDEGYVVCVTPSGNLLTTGTFRGTGDFDPSSNTNNLTSEGFVDIFFQMLDTDGNYLWAEQIGGTFFEYLHGMHIDVTGNIYATGGFEETVDFDPSLGSTDFLSSNGDEDIFVQKLNSLLDLKEKGLENEYVIYPNPTKDKLFIDFNSFLTNVKISIVNVQGSVIRSLEYVNTDQVNFELDAPPGVYLIEIENSFGKSYLRLIKQ